jgi:hypothetical protein
MASISKYLPHASVLAALLAVFLPAEQFAYFPALLVALGLASGFLSPTEDVSSRVALYVLAATLPSIASSLDVIPGIGVLLSGFLVEFSVVIAGIALANLFTVLGKQVKDAL